MVFSCAFAQEQNNALQPQMRAASYFQQAQQAMEQSDINKALEFYQKGLAIDPTDVNAYNQVGIILTLQGATDQAREFFFRAIEVDPGYAKTYSNLATLYENEGDVVSAALCWMKRINLASPQDPWAGKARERLEEIVRANPDVYTLIQSGEYATTMPVAVLQSLSVDGATGMLYQQPSRVSLFDDSSAQAQAQTKDDASQYFQRAQDSFANGQYVAALKDATIAEYLDPTNKQISTFVQQIRKAIMQ